MNSYQFFAERKKLPPVATRVITGNVMVAIIRNDGKVAFGAQVVTDEWWANQCRSKS